MFVNHEICHICWSRFLAVSVTEPSSSQCILPFYFVPLLSVSKTCLNKKCSFISLKTSEKIKYFSCFQCKNFILNTGNLLFLFFFFILTRVLPCTLCITRRQGNVIKRKGKYYKAVLSPKSWFRYFHNPVLLLPASYFVWHLLASNAWTLSCSWRYLDHNLEIKLSHNTSRNMNLPKSRCCISVKNCIL